MTDLKTGWKKDTIDTSPEAVKKTGDAFLMACSLIGAFLFLYMSYSSGAGGWNWAAGYESPAWKWIAGTGILMFVASRVAYPLVRPLHKGWMTLAWALGWFSSGVLLTIYFYFVITPVGVIMRIAGKDLLNEKPDPLADTYWEKREQQTIRKEDMERLF